MSALIAAGAVLLGVLIGAVPTYLIARDQHKMELAKLWWERKEEAYAVVIDTLVSLTYSLDKRWKDEVSQLTNPDYNPSPEVQEAIRSEYVKARENLERAVVEGDYLLSEKAVTALSNLIQQFKKALPEPHSWSEVVDKMGQDLTAARDCCKVVREEAKLDLQVE
jgi:hypothetical protein